MPIVETDIDIDFPDRTLALQGLTHIPAMMVSNLGQKARHNSGVYLQDVPFDPLTGLCAYPYEEASQHGYFKIDFLTNTIYRGVRDEAHLLELMEREPEWSLLEFEDVVDRLAHVRGHYDVVRLIRPNSVEDLAVVLAMIRPGKTYLRTRSRQEIDAQIWTTDGDGYGFKRAHAIAYAVSIAVQLNLLFDEMSAGIDAEKSRSEDEA